MNPTVREVRRAGAERVDQSETITQAARKMAEHDVGALPIYGPQDRFRGVLTERDIVVRVLAAGRHPDRTSVGELAPDAARPARRRPASTVTPDGAGGDDMLEAWEQARSHGGELEDSAATRQAGAPMGRRWRRAGTFSSDA